MRKRVEVPAILLAVVLQYAPLTRLVPALVGAPAPGFAQILRCTLGVVALLGSYDAVSAASASIDGVYNTNPLGRVTNTATGQVGQAFSYQIDVINSGTNPELAYFNATPLPPGLTINTNYGGDGLIMGIPTVAKSSLVLLTAGNKNSDLIVHKQIQIIIQAGDLSPPVITGPPTDQIASTGATVTFTVTATGNNLVYQWRLNDADLQNANSASLTLSQVTTNQSGFYSVLVSNSATNVISRAAQLLVVPPPGPDMAPSFEPPGIVAGQMTLSLPLLAGYSYRVESSDTLQPGSWVALTNYPASVVSAKLDLRQNTTAAPRRFYRVRVAGSE